MRPLPEVHDALACLLTYPGEANGSRYRAAARVVRELVPEIASGLDSFLKGIESLNEGELEELYTRTFDNVAERSLEIGWQLYGENYSRGVMLVRLRELLRQYGIPERVELPDHLAHVLPLLARAEVTLAAILAKGDARHAVEKCLEALRLIASPWCGVLEVVLAVLAQHELPAKVQEVRS